MFSEPRTVLRLNLYRLVLYLEPSELSVDEERKTLRYRGEATRKGRIAEKNNAEAAEKAAAEKTVRVLGKFQDQHISQRPRSHTRRQGSLDPGTHPDRSPVPNDQRLVSIPRSTPSATPQAKENDDNRPRSRCGHGR